MGPFLGPRGPTPGPLFWGPPGPAPGRARRAPRGARGCTFRRVFNNSPSRDRMGQNGIFGFLAKIALSGYPIFPSYFMCSGFGPGRVRGARPARARRGGTYRGPGQNPGFWPIFAPRRPPKNGPFWGLFGALFGGQKWPFLGPFLTPPYTPQTDPQNDPPKRPPKGVPTDGVLIPRGYTNHTASKLPQHH